MKYRAALETAERVTARQLADRILSLPVGELLHVWRLGIRETSVDDAHVDVTSAGSVYVSGRAPERCDRFRSFFTYDVDGNPTVFGVDGDRFYTEQRRINR